MPKNLVIVESPAKAKTIEGYLGKDFIVTSSYGHIRDLDKKKNGVEVDKNFNPLYIIPEDKKNVVKDLQKLAKKTETVWLASDEDREGEAISWHLKEVLSIPDNKIKRIVFHEITKNAITRAVQNPRGINNDLVESQQARRILDRLVGFEISPVLWKKVRPNLSAGRVQSVAVRLIVEREREIQDFKPEASFRVTAEFKIKTDDGTAILKAELPKRFDKEKDAREFLEKCGKAEFTVDSLEKKPAKKSPAPPFTTSTLQQEASRKLRFSVSKTMLLAQRLYEAGKITYMRTDSVNLSDEALEGAARSIKKDYGEDYYKRRTYKTKTASAQEAHESIRPTDFSKSSQGDSKDEKALYELIWKRAIASQMSDAKLERTTVKIGISTTDEKFSAQGEVIKFDGFLKVYLESTDEEESNGKAEQGLLPPMKEGQKLPLKVMHATQRYTRHPARYTEASLVKKLEELGIGRPSTYAPTISTIQKRGYIATGEKPGVEREYKVFTLNSSGVNEKTETEVTGAEKGKLYPNDIAMLVNDFLIDNFPKIMDYKFTANVEKELDDVANGSMDWREMLKEFYFPFHDRVEETIENSEKVKGERFLGKDPDTGKQVSVRMARFGPVAQKKMNPEDPDEKPEFAGLRPGQRLESVTLEEALTLFKLPRNLGEFEHANVTASVGRFGPYVRHSGKFYSLGKELDPYTVTLDEAIKVIEDKRKKDAEKTLVTFEEDPDFKILKGRWGPYLKAGTSNVKLPKDCDYKKLTYRECVKLAEEAGAGVKSKKGAKSNGAKGKSTAKKTTGRKSSTKKK